MNINLDYYRIFYMVASTGKITSAAEELHITQPAVSQAIHTLEEEMGVSLFRRSRRGVEMTEAGNVLFHYVAEGLAAFENGERKVEGLKALDYGELSIGASDMTLQYYLLPYLEKYHTLYPNIKIHVTNAPTPLTIQHMMAGAIDFGVVSTPIEADSRIAIHETRDIRDVFIAGPKYDFLRAKTLSYKDLTKYPIICLENKTSTRKYVDSFLATKGIVLQPEFELATSNMIVQFVTQNLGIGCVVSDFAARFEKQDRVFELKFRGEIPKRKFCIITDTRQELSTAAKKLLELLQQDD